MPGCQLHSAEFSNKKTINPANTTGRPIYLDCMATTPVDPAVLSAMQECLTLEGDFGNPASLTHVYGRAAAARVEAARAALAALVAADPQEIVWTSGATEANNLAILGAVDFYQRKGRHIVTVATEHSSVLGACRRLGQLGYQVTYLHPRSDGLLDMQQLQQALQPDTILLSVMHVNNEIGVIQDIAAIAQSTRARGVLLHVDAAQSLGKIPIRLQDSGIDLMSFSGHKIYAPKGIGALYVRRRPRVRLTPQIWGGEQEGGLRAGTLPVAQIVAMGQACQIASHVMPAEQARIRHLRERLWHELQAALPDIYLNGHAEQRVAGNLSVSFAGIHGEALVWALQAQLAVSTTSACQSAHDQPSHVLSALKVPKQLSLSTLRLGLGRFTTEEEVNTAIAAIVAAVNRLRAMSPEWRK